jgi:hypothetical protein
VTKHMKIVTDGPREQLRLAILDVEHATASAAKAEAAVVKALSALRTAKTAHAVAEAKLEEATSPPRTLDQKLKEAESVDEMLEIADAHNDSLRREPLTAEDLKRLRSAVEEATDALTVARQALEASEYDARPTVSALNRARDRRTLAVQALVAPHIARLVGDVDLRVQELVAARAALAFVSSNLIDWSSEERRRASFALNDTPAYPEEGGFKIDRDTSKRQAAIEAWQNFAEAITADAAAPFPAL